MIRDANETKLIKDLLLPTGEQELPIVIQDKVFQANGDLAYTGDIPIFNGWNTLPPHYNTPRRGRYRPTIRSRWMPLDCP